MTMEEVAEAAEGPKEMAVAMEDRYVAIQVTEGGYDYTIYDQNFRLLDGGVLDNDSISIEHALKEIVSDLEGNIRGGIQAESEMRTMDYDGLMDQVAEVENTEITYIVSECNEFPGLGEYHTAIPSVEEAVKAFDAIDPKSMNGIPSIAMNVHMKGQDPIEDMQIDLVVGRRIDADILRYVPDIKDNPHVQEGITALISLLPDFPIEGKEQIHQMPTTYQRDSAGTLAQAMDQFMYGIDSKAYETNGVRREENIQRITDEIRQGQAGYLKEYLKEIVYDTGCSHDLQVDARNLMQRMSKYEKENPIAHIEELEEDNPNMVDGIRNNSSPKDKEEAKKDTVSRNEPEKKVPDKKGVPARASLKERLKQKQLLVGGADGGEQGRAQQREVN